jgi:hypothetical protein
MTQSRTSLRNLSTALLLFPLLAGCGLGTATTGNDSNVAADTTDTANQVVSITSVTSDGVDLTAAGITSNAAATVAAAGVIARVTPAGCATQSVVNNVATYTFTSCTGPYGLLSFTGSVQATYTVTLGPPASLKLDLTGTAQTQNGGTLNLKSSAIISGPPTNRTAVVTESSSAVSARGNSISHTGSYTAGWDGMCVSLGGNWSTTAALLTWATTVTNYKRCQNHCPLVGGSLRLVGPLHTTTLSFDGTATGQFTFDGKPGTIPLFCQ